ncbi:MAG: hypothetical protein GF401_20320 [Chitinivibrionales bacterium]|nr:hypothetical protein [Chitinivibrionales bacterium]
MQKTYRYQNYLLKGHLALYGLLAFGMIFLWATPWLVHWAGYGVIPQFYRLRLYLSVTILLFAGLTHIISRELRGTSWVLSDDTLLWRRLFRTTVLHCENVTTFRYVALPFVRGFAVLKTPKVEIRLPFVIDRFSELIDSLYENLKRHNRESAIPREEYRRLKRNALLSEYTTARIYRWAPSLLRYSTFLFVFGMVVAYHFWYFPIHWSLGWGIASGILPFLTFLIADGTITRITDGALQTKNEVPRIDESKVMIGTAWDVCVGYLVFGFIIRNVVVGLVRYFYLR